MAAGKTSCYKLVDKDESHFIDRKDIIMLVLTRASGERLVIGDDGDITLTILDVRGNQVRLGIEAPKHISVHREEIFLRIQNVVPEEEPVEG